MNDGSHKIPFENIDIESLKKLCPDAFWSLNPRLALSIALSASNAFDSEDYLRRYPDVKQAGLNAVWHYLNMGIKEKRTIKSRVALPSVTKSNTALPRRPGYPLARSYSVIVDLRKTLHRITEQYFVLKKQTLPPIEIIYLINDKTDPSLLQTATGTDVKFVRSDMNSPFVALDAARMARGEYVAILESGTLMGEYWFANAMRTSLAYNAIAVSEGALLSSTSANGIYKTVTPAEANDDNLTCAYSDIFCDWGTKCLLLKREWINEIKPMTFESDRNVMYVYLAFEIYIAKGVKCVTPMQPSYEPRLSGSTLEVGIQICEDKIFPKKEILLKIIEEARSRGYADVNSRDNLFKFHIITAFGNRGQLKRCLLSLKAQRYDNYACTLIDDCCDASDAISIFNEIELDADKYYYIRNKRKIFNVTGSVYAIELSQANPSDVIVCLDGDDWLIHPDVLSQLNAIYRQGDTLATYGNSVQLTSWNTHNFEEFCEGRMSYAWNIANNFPEARVTPVGRIPKNALTDGWGNSPWSNFHPRSRLYASWLELDRSVLKFSDGKKANLLYDALTLIPQFNRVAKESLKFLDDPAYAYQNAANTTFRANTFSQVENEASKCIVAHYDAKKQSLNACTWLRRYEKVAAPIGFEADAELIIPNEDKPMSSLNTNSRNDQNNAQTSAIITIVTANYIAEALLSLTSYIRNCSYDCDTYIVVCQENIYDVDLIKILMNNTNINILLDTDLVFTSEKVVLLKNKYQGDKYRWSMKSVVLIELIKRGYNTVTFLDPDIYTVSNIDDIHKELTSHPITLYPHYRNPENPDSRNLFYSDGVFNGGMLSASDSSIEVLERWFYRCVDKMEKDTKNHFYDDQKYLELMPLEIDGVHVNKDRGIDYCPIWNIDEAQGLVAPDQRAYLLDSGRFVRMWHISRDLIYSLSIKDIANAEHSRPICVIYLWSKLLLLVLLAIGFKKKGIHDTGDMLGLKTRFVNIKHNITDLSLYANITGICDLWEKAWAATPNETDNLLLAWEVAYLDSICFGNSEVFALLIDQLFPESEDASRIVKRMRKLDLRYATENVLANPGLSQDEKVSLLPDLAAGEIVKMQIERLRSCNLSY